ncbi:hypothetical protein BDF21DRAFT_399552 [Thamnidium elegans]|nr:hypothetical protein BDF21DRAFT_399552 [Thamnidium elegans]
MSNNRKRKINCYCLECDGACVPFTTARNHKEENKFKDSLVQSSLVASSIMVFTSIITDGNVELSYFEKFKALLTKPLETDTPIADNTLSFSGFLISSIEAEFSHVADAVEQDSLDLELFNDGESIVFGDDNVSILEDTIEEFALPEENWMDEHGATAKK